MAILKYHQKTLDLINSEPQFSGEAFPNLPASVSEWFSLSNGFSLLKEYSKEDLPIDPSRFQVCKFNGKNLLVFMYENNRMVCLAFENSNVDDPPVYVIRDPSDDNYPVEFVSEHCSLLEEKFSGFLYKWFFDYSHWHEDGLFIFALSRKPLQAETLELLKTEFKTEPFVIAYFDVQTEASLIYLVVKNIGCTVATQVKLTFMPKLRSSNNNRLLKKWGL
jgi:hypothetical protein